MNLKIMTDKYWCPECKRTFDSDVDEHGIGYICGWCEDDTDDFVEIVPIGQGRKPIDPDSLRITGRYSYDEVMKEIKDEQERSARKNTESDND